MGVDSGAKKYQRAVEMFFALHEKDPKQVSVGAKNLPYAVHYHRTLVRWVRKLAVEPSEELLLAAHAQHLCRWEIPRQTYPMNREGYKRWRSRLAEFHSEKASEILSGCGYPTASIERVRSFLTKKMFKVDPEVQLFEDAICLVFLQIEFESFRREHDRDKLTKILQRTWKKMSERGREEALRLSSSLSQGAREVLEEALSG